MEKPARTGPRPVDPDDVFVVQRVVPMKTQELLACAEEQGAAFAREDWDRWPYRREQAAPWGTPPTSGWTHGDANCIRYGCTSEMHRLALEWMSGHGFPGLSSRLYDHDKWGVVHYAVAGAFYRGAMRTWGELREQERRDVIERGLRHLDGLWRE